MESATSKFCQIISSTETKMVIWKGLSWNFVSFVSLKVAETCQLALQRIKWLNEKSSQESKNLR